jgi:hypothetical protein
MMLELLLKKELDNNPYNYSDESIERVRETISIIDENSNDMNPYKHFEHIDDFKLYYNVNPSIKGRNTNSLQSGTYEQKRFYFSLIHFARKNSNGNRDIQKNLVKTVFPTLREEKFRYSNLQEWKKHFNSHSEWSGKSTVEMRSNTDEMKELYKFYLNLRDWAIKETAGNRKLQGELMRKIMPHLYVRKSMFTIDDWISEKKKVPQWENLRACDIKKDRKNHGFTFVSSAYSWVQKEAGDNKEYRKYLLDKIYERKSKT